MKKENRAGVSMINEQEQERSRSASSRVKEGAGNGRIVVPEQYYLNRMAARGGGEAEAGRMPHNARTERVEVETMSRDIAVCM